MARTLTARRAGVCAACGAAFAAGATISWDRGSRTACCSGCPHPAAEPMTPEEWAERREAKADRFRTYADNAAQRSDAARRARDGIASGIPLGQPILVGHHSERRARRDAGRIHDLTGRAIEEDRKAGYWEGRAATVEADRSIDGRDPEAVTKLRAKVDALELRRERVKSVNAQIRRGVKLDDIVPPLTEAETKDLQMAARFNGTKGFPAYVLSNLGSEVRRCQARIAQLTGVA